MRKPNSQQWRFVQGIPAVNNIIVPRRSVVPNPHMLLTLIRIGSKFFTVIDLCSAFFSIPVDEASQYLLPSLRKRNNSPGHKASGLYWESFLFFTNPKSWPGWHKVFLWSTLWPYVDILLLCSPSQASSQEGSILFLKLLP